MKITELMIDNWIQLNNSNYRIKRINKNGHMILWEKFGKYELEPEFNTSHLIDVIEPIKVTPEILENNGFDEYCGLWPYPTYRYDDGINVCITFAFPAGKKTTRTKSFIEIDTKDNYIQCFQCEYVHQLQNILRLCNINKDIEL